jgi:hypothetical protein
MMRIFGLIGILAALVIVMVLVARQLSAVGAPAGSVTSPQQARQIEQQYKKAVEDALKQPQRDAPDEAK